MLRRLAPSMDKRHPGRRANSAGLRTGTGKAFGVDAVEELRYSYRVGFPGSWILASSPPHRSLPASA